MGGNYIPAAPRLKVILDRFLSQTRKRAIAQVAQAEGRSTGPMCLVLFFPKDVYTEIGGDEGRGGKCPLLDESWGVKDREQE